MARRSGGGEGKAEERKRDKRQAVGWFPSASACQQSRPVPQCSCSNMHATCVLGEVLPKRQK